MKMQAPSFCNGFIPCATVNNLGILCSVTIILLAYSFPEWQLTTVAKVSVLLTVTGTDNSNKYPEQLWSQWCVSVFRRILSRRWTRCGLCEPRKILSRRVTPVYCPCSFMRSMFYLQCRSVFRFYYAIIFGFIQNCRPWCLGVSFRAHAFMLLKCLVDQGQNLPSCPSSFCCIKRDWEISHHSFTSYCKTSFSRAFSLFTHQLH